MAVPQRGRQLRCPPDSDVPVGRMLGDGLQVAPPSEHRGRRLGTPAGQARESVRAVADEGEVVRDRRRRHAELGDDAVLVDQPRLAPVELDDPGAPHALAEVLVRRADDDLLDRWVVGRYRGRAGQRVVGLDVDHRPDRHAHRDQRLLERPRLGPEIRVDALAGLVARPQVVAERLDHVVRCHADVRRAVAEQAEDRPEHAPDRRDLQAVGVVVGRGAEEMAEQFVRPVDQMHPHGVSLPRERRAPGRRRG